MCRTHSIHSISFVVALGISTTLHIVIGEQAPKNWAIRYADRALPILAGPLVVVHVYFFPRDLGAQLGHNGVLRLSGMRLDSKIGGETAAYRR